jgi:hypothetical protein
MFELPPTSLPAAHLSKNDQHIDGQTVAMNDLQKNYYLSSHTNMYPKYLGKITDIYTASRNEGPFSIMSYFKNSVQGMGLYIWTTQIGLVQGYVLELNPRLLEQS